MGTKKKATTKKKAAKKTPSRKASAPLVGKRGPGRPPKPLDPEAQLRRVGYTQAQISALMEECQTNGLEAAKAFWFDLNRRFKRVEELRKHLAISEADGFNGHLTTDYGAERTPAKQRRAELQAKVDEEAQDLAMLMAKVMAYVIPQKRAIEADVQVKAVSLVDILKQSAMD